jgi:hypothetical protein
MRKIRISLLFVFVCVFLTPKIYSQSSTQVANPITTAVPFLLIAPDARGGGMGNAGVSTSPDAFSIYWNPAKYAFIDKNFGFAIGYMPWLRGLVNDIGLASVSGFKKFGDKQAIAASLRFFSMGKVQFTDDQGQNTIEVNPNEFAIDVAYSRKFSKSISGAVTGRYIYSNLIPAQGAGQTFEAKPGQSVAADISLYYHKELEIKGLTGSSFDFGFNISNIGSKISYSSTSIVRDFIPTNLRIGPSMTMDIDEFNRISFGVDFNKLLVPTPPIYYPDSIVNDNKVIYKGKDPKVSPVAGMIQSFYDAPYGTKEELDEVNLSAYTEYWYNKLFAIRAGYFYESKYKGDRQFVTLGAGLRYSVFGLDFSYLIPVKSNNPLQNTMQFTLHFNFDQAGKKEKQDTKE